ncbi:EcsC family protein [Shouchella rhizosphaerae]|uniref:EcsC family protein n=1 Tax=Shouchella rhizosphaerae TaxID=866786 RepID=UPI0032516D77
MKTEIALMHDRVRKYEKQLYEQAQSPMTTPVPLQKAGMRTLAQLEPFVLQLHPFITKDQWFKQRAKETFTPLPVSASEQQITIHEQKLNREEAKIRLLSAGKGAYLAKGKRMALTLPAQLYACGRAIALIGHAYGYKGDTALESLYAIRLLHLSFLPRYARLAEWELLQKELAEHEKGQPFYQSREDLFSDELLVSLALQSMKWGLIRSVSNKQIAGKSLATSAVGAYSFYKQTQTTLAAARVFYQKRWLNSRERIYYTKTRR